MLVVFTDLDGSLLDHHTYSFDAARPALGLLARRGIPVVLTTSKTRAEVEVCRKQLANRHPFIVENGGAAFVPRAYFPFAIPGAAARNGHDVIEFGDRYDDLVETLHEASRLSGSPFLGFHQMTPEEIAIRCDLSLGQARLARNREYDEPFEVFGPASGSRLLRAIEQLGKRWTLGGRFHHITGDNDKAAGVRALTTLYRRLYGSVTTVALGDSPNDAALLAAVDVPVVVRSPHANALRHLVPRARVTEAPGPEGWNRALLEMIPE